MSESRTQYTDCWPVVHHVCPNGYASDLRFPGGDARDGKSMQCLACGTTIIYRKPLPRRKDSSEQGPRRHF